jgi:hypothetical protein
MAFLVILGILAQKAVAITAIMILGLMKLVLKANKSTDKVGDNIKITMMGSVRIAKGKNPVCRLSLLRAGVTQNFCQCFLNYVADPTLGNNVYPQ